VEVVVSFRSVTSNGVSSRVNLFGRTLALAASVVALAFLVACSNSNNNSTGVKCPGDTGSFSNSSLAAGSQWTYELSGFQPTPGGSVTPYREAGVFTVDGNGNITSGTDDFYQQGVNTTGAISTGITGKYNITANGTGTMTVTLPNAGSLTWAITLTGSNAFYIIEADTFANAHGRAVQQTASAFAAPSGTLAFRAHALGSVSGFSSVVGEVTVSGGNVTSGSADVLSGGVEFTTTVTGSFAAPDSTGRGSATLNYGLGSFTFEYYVIDANTVNLFETDTNNLALGRMEMQTGAGTFVNASLSGPFAFGSRGDINVSGIHAVNSVGALVLDGAGSITSGTYDFVQDGTPGSVLSLTGTYSVTNANGRVAITLNPTGANQVSEVAYLVSPTRAFFLVNDLSKVEDGTADQQSSTSFSNSSLSGQFGFVMGGYDPTDFVDRTGPLHSDGAGNLSLAEVLNRTGLVTTPGCLAGTYSVAPNGRVAANIPSLSSNLVLYMVSTDQAYLLQGDAGTEIFGGAAIQSGAVVDPPGGF
jgi:hypothetical protein